MAAGPTLLIAAKPQDKTFRDGSIDLAVIAPAEQLGKAFAMVAAHVRPCVVSVYSEKAVKSTQPESGGPFGDDFLRQFFGDQLPPPEQQMPRQRESRVPQRGMGSGMIIDKKGYILTNFHVVNDVDRIKVQLADKSEYEAEIVGTDPQTDIAVIKIKGHVPDDLPTVTLGESGALQPGDLVLAIGAPFGLLQTVTTGIISAIGRSDMGIEDYEDFLQTDAPINPGNSGGPLCNMRGEVIGMNTAIATSLGQSAGVGFAIPSSMIKTVLPKLMKGEKIVRGQLGVVIQNVTKDFAKQFGLSEPKGVLVSQVNKESAAETAGIRVGDVIARYDGHDVRDVSHLRNLVAATVPGTEVKIEVTRKGKTETFTAAVGKQEITATGAMPPGEGGEVLDKLGLSIQTLTSDWATQLGVEGGAGAVISDVKEGNPAAIAGLQPGDIIVEVDHQKVASADDVRQILTKAKDRDTVLLLIKRKGANLFFVLALR